MRRRLFWVAVVWAVAVWAASLWLGVARPVRYSQVTPRRTHHRIDVNAADAAAVSLLPGLGPGLALRVVDDRAAHGPFESVQALTRVRDIGPKRLERLRPWATAEAPR